MSPRSRFEQEVLPHLDAGYNLARWLLHDAFAADDAVQDASIRALRYLSGMRGENPKAWFLAIVRRCCFDWLADHRRRAETGDVELEAEPECTDEAGPEHAAHLHERAVSLVCALEALAPVYREVIVLRELEDLSYKEIARVADIPIGTVMSRLARARAMLQRSPHLEEVRGPVTKSQA